MNNQNEKFELYKFRKAIYDILDIIDDNFRNPKKKGQISYEQMFTLMRDERQLIETYIGLELETCVSIIKKRYIPIINLLMKLDKEQKHKNQYLDDLENAYRLGARDDFHCFLIYYEWDSNDKVYEKRYSILNSYVYYLNVMAHDPTFELLIGNLPSGYGKTRIEKLYEAWRFGRQPDGTFLSLCSNDQVVKGGSRSVIDIIKNERYGKVFPNLSYQSYGKDLFLKETDGEWKLKDCAMLASYYASTVNSNVVGLRASLSVHIDDMYARPSEAMDEVTNKRYFDDYMTVWRERFVKGKLPQIVITGTMWSPTDFIVRVIEMTENDDKFHKHAFFKYTKISEDKKKVIIQVPALDPDTDLSTCPELVSTKELYKKRRNIDRYLWETNFQQNPTTPEGLEFDWKNIQTYDELPNDMYEYSYAVIDGTRKSGKDFFAMPIWKDYYDKLALVDCIFTKVATSELIDDIIEKIINHHIVKLVIESNVDGGLRKTLEEKLHERNVYYCVIIEKYSFEKKSIRIEAEKGNIAHKLVFPSKKVLDPNTDMSKYMQNLTVYNSTGRNRNDDAPDSAAMTTAEIIGEKTKSNKAKFGKRPW